MRKNLNDDLRPTKLGNPLHPFCLYTLTQPTSSNTQGFYSRIAASPNTLRVLMNLWPPFLGMRIHIEHISPDWRSARVRMKLSLRNKNYVGTHFGGALFAMTDPFYMLLLMNCLGKTHTVWDKAASINFLKPGRGTVWANFEVQKPRVVKRLNPRTPCALWTQRASASHRCRKRFGFEHAHHDERFLQRSEKRAIILC
jgi:acyl-coenzyme A thioesterase PaaI-like protein